MQLEELGKSELELTYLPPQDKYKFTLLMSYCYEKSVINIDLLVLSIKSSLTY